MHFASFATSRSSFLCCCGVEKVNEKDHMYLLFCDLGQLTEIFKCFGIKGKIRYVRNNTNAETEAFARRIFDITCYKQPSLIWSHYQHDVSCDARVYLWWNAHYAPDPSPPNVQLLNRKRRDGSHNGHHNTAPTFWGTQEFHCIQTQTLPVSLFT